MIAMYNIMVGMVKPSMDIARRHHLPCEYMVRLLTRVKPIHVHLVIIIGQWRCDNHLYHMHCRFQRVIGICIPFSHFVIIHAKVMKIFTRYMMIQIHTNMIAIAYLECVYQDRSFNTNPFTLHLL